MQSRRPGNVHDLRPPEIPAGVIRLVITAFIVLLVIFSAVFTIEPEEVGVILRFGKYERTESSGLHFKLPLMESVTKVPVERQEKEEFGFRTISAGKRTQFSTRSYEEESLMLTGDLNAADVEWIVQYRIDNPYNYLFKVRNARQTFRDINEALMREIIGDRTVNEVLTIGRQEIADAMTVKLQDICEQYELGIRVDQVVLQDVTPPDRVKPAFNEVNEAQQEKEKLINQARAAYNQVIPKARGEAERTIQEAYGYATERINNARGDSAQFSAIFKEYVKAKEVTKQRIFLETMNDVLPKVGRKLITDDDASGILPLFNLQQGGGK
ncbi:FtsH protease activity modulator HflK [candidate division KSB1 bacterium]|nr:FtsH protease activity modulator HflK [candidate division KSB1 bacterium]